MGLILIGVMVFSYAMANYQNFRTVCKNQTEINEKLDEILRELKNKS